MRNRCCSWSMMAMIPMMAGMKAATRGRKDWTIACKQPAPRTPNTDIVETAKAAGAFSRLVEALQSAGLVDVLKAEGPFTVFAPTDDAFAKLPAEALESVLKDQEKLKSLLTYHVVPGRYRASDLPGIDALRTLQGTPLKLDTRLGVKVGSAYVIQGDMAATNGVIHAIDSVLVP